MNLGDPKAVLCPCCDKTLYELVLIDAHGNEGIWGLRKGSPSIEHDENGAFMKCRQCSCRVIMKSAPSPVGAGYDIAETQTCVRI